MTSRPKTVLSPALAARLLALASADSDTVGHELKEIISEIAALPPSSIARASREIAINARHWYGGDPIDNKNLKSNSDYAWLFLFHPNGYLREAALNRLDAAPQSPFFLSALAWRLNDWVVPVRRAAKRCIERVSSQIPPAVAADAALYLLERRIASGYWRNEATILDISLERADVLAALADRLQSRPDGPMAACLRHMLRYHRGIDNHLPQLAAGAIQPSVRAVAYRCLITGKAHWRVGWGEQNLEFREIARAHSPADYIAESVRDRSALVRRTVADCMIAVRQQLPIDESLIAILAKDRNPAVRSRADFMLRHPLQQA